MGGNPKENLEVVCDDREEERERKLLEYPIGCGGSPGKAP